MTPRRTQPGTIYDQFTFARAFVAIGFVAAARPSTASRPEARISSESSPLPATRDITSCLLYTSDAADE